MMREAGGVTVGTAELGIRVVVNVTVTANV